MNNKDKPKKAVPLDGNFILPKEKMALSDELSKFSAEISRIMMENDVFKREKDSMLCTMAALVMRLGGRVVIGQDDAEFIKKWQAGIVTLTVETESINPNFITFILTVETKGIIATV